jgi:ATP-dependent Clp protease protease subunit
MPHLRQASAADESAKPISSSLVQEHLFAARTVLIFGEVTMPLAEAVTAQLLALDEQGSSPIRVVIHSPGGHVEAADTMHDVIQSLRAPVRMIGTGWVASAGALIYVAAPRSHRIALPNTRFLLHQPMGGVSGPSTDVEIEARQILAMRERLQQIFAAATGKPLEKIASDTERNHWMTAEEALEYGLVGSIQKTTSQFAE